MGNITQVKDAVLPDVFFDNKIISADQLYTYDALYRLIKAEGREQQGLADFGGQDNYDDSAWQSGHKGNGDITHRYIQHYLYDAVGNIMQLRHIVPSNTAYSYTRNYGYSSSSNRLDSTEVTGAMTTPYAYVHDARGNMTELPHLDDIYWNVRNELHKIEQGTMAAYYQYSGGQRIRKYVVKGSIAEERIYLGSFEIYRKFDSGSLTIERHTVHVSDDTGRIAMLEKRTVGDRLDDHDTEEVLVRYIYSNHLQSASLELDEHAAIISYEEYHSYGTTSFQSNDETIHANAKRYRYTGKERDEESGLYYHGARYYIPWLCRWSAVDPLESEYAGWSPYHYVKCNPVMDTDSTGMGGDDDLKLPKGVRNGGVAGGFTGGSEMSLPENSGTSKQAPQKKGLTFNALRVPTQNYDSSYSWLLQPETFNNNVTASLTNTLSDAAEYVGNYFTPEGRQENSRRTYNAAMGMAKAAETHERSWNKGPTYAWNSFYAPVLTSPETYEDAAAGWALGYVAEGALSIAARLPKIKVGFGVKATSSQTEQVSFLSKPKKNVPEIRIVDEDGPYVFATDESNVTGGHAWLGANGELNLFIKTKGTSLEGHGGAVFNRLYEYINTNFNEVKSIRGTWRAGEMADNLNTFNSLYHLGEQKAALGTFTGKMATRLGFNNVILLGKGGTSPNFFSVDILFKR